MTAKHIFARAVVCTTLAVAGVGCLGGCQRYPEVSRPAYDTAKIMVNVCNARQPEQIPRARQLIQEQLEAGEISDAEYGMLVDITDLAAEGDWEAAEAEARKLIVHQAEW